MFHKFERYMYVYLEHISALEIGENLLLKRNMPMVQPVSLCIISVWVYYEIIYHASVIKFSIIFSFTLDVQIAY